MNDIESKEKEVKHTFVDYDVYYAEDEEGNSTFKPPSTLYVLTCLGVVFYYTRSVELAQKACDEDFGVGFYRIRSTNGFKSKSRREGGSLSASGTTSRRGTGSWLKKTV